MFALFRTGLGLICCLLCPLWLHAAAPKGFVLHAEKTQFRETGTYAEVQAFCRAMRQQHPHAVRCLQFGQSAEGRPLLAMVVSQSGVLDAPRVRQRQLPVTLVIGGTHAGEIDGKDAGMILIRDLLAQPQAYPPLKQQVLLFVPVFNVDGHERPRAYNRPNQNGPRLQGERVTAQRINLNRDWMLAQTPEMQAMLQLLGQWDPLVTLDMHVTDGLRFRHDVSLSVSAMFTGTPSLKRLAEDFEDALIEHIEAKGHHPLDFTPVLVDLDDPSQGFMKDADAPRFSHVYASVRNRLGILVENHAWDSYGQRIQTSRDVLISAIDLVAKTGSALRRMARLADEQATRLQGQVVHLDWKNALEIGNNLPTGKMDVLGYAYTVHSDAPVVGGKHISYHLDRPETWSIPLFGDILPLNEATVTLPQGGYLVPAAWAPLVKPHLDRHGIVYKKLRQALRQQAVEEIRVDVEQITFDTSTYQGRLRSYVRGEWRPARGSLPAGSLYVPIAQPKGMLVAHLLEPLGPDSLSTWGLFNTAYEVNDHVANHRQLQLAQWMHAGDPVIRELYGDQLHSNLNSLREEYQDRLERDDRFREDPESRVEFWMSGLPHHDPNINLYPILRTDQRY